MRNSRMRPKTVDVPDSARRFPLATWGQVRRELGAQIRAVPGARRWGLVALVLMAIGAWATVSVPRLLGQTVDVVRRVTGDRATSWADSGLGWIGLKMLLAAVIGGVASAAGYYLMSRISERVIANLRETMVGTALSLPLHQVESAGTADLVSRSTDDVAEVSAAITDTLPLLSKSTFLIVVTATALVAVDPRLLLCALVAVIPYWWGARRYLRVAPERFAAERAGMAERARRVLEAIHGRETIRAFRMESDMHDRIASASWDVVGKGIRARMALLRFQLWMSAGEFLLSASVLVGGYFFVRAGWVSVGAVTGAGLMVIRLRGPLLHLMRQLDVIQSAYASLSRIVGVSVDPPHQVSDCPDAEVADSSVRFTGGTEHSKIQPARERPVVELRNVTFSYRETAADPNTKKTSVSHSAACQLSFAVDDVSLSVYPGQTVAVVGASGAGKTTVASLLMGLRIPDSGEVLVAGVPVSLLSDAQRAALIAMVSQEVHTFAGTLREDLNLANPDATDDQIRDAVARVGAQEWFDSLPNGLDTVVGEQGVRPNSVVAQQLALARVLLLDPPVVVMDEATAEAGSAHAEALEKAASEVLHNRSALVVAHRLNQARAADRVLVMEAGRIVESGTHDELVSNGGVYAEMWSAWARGS